MDNIVNYILLSDLSPEIQYEYKVFAGVKGSIPSIFIYTEDSPFVPKLRAYIKLNFSPSNKQPFILVP